MENREEKGKIGEKEEEDEPKDASLTTTRSPVVLFEEDHPPTTATGSSRTAADVLDHTKQIFANAEDILAKVGKISGERAKRASFEEVTRDESREMVTDGYIHH